MQSRIQSDRFKSKLFCDTLTKDCVNMSIPLREFGDLKKTFGKALDGRGSSLLSAFQEFLKSKITLHSGAIVKSIAATHNIESSTPVEYPAVGIGAKPYRPSGQSFNRCSAPLSSLYAHTTLKEVMSFE
jgi:hypothetical protein